MFTIEIYKIDRRTKSGTRLLTKRDINDTRENVENYVNILCKNIGGSFAEIHQTYVTRTNAITGKTFEERYDTPYFCSPSSESFWSN